MAQSQDELSEYEVTAYYLSDTATSGEVAKVHTVEASSANEAQEKVKQESGVVRVDTSLTVSFKRGENGERVYA